MYRNGQFLAVKRVEREDNVGEEGRCCIVDGGEVGTMDSILVVVGKSKKNVAFWLRRCLVDGYVVLCMRHGIQ